MPEPAAKRPTPPVKDRAQSARLKVIEAEELFLHVDAWRRLADMAVVPNPFYEPWTLLPAIDHLRERKQLKFALVFGPGDKGGIETLWGFFPLEIQQRCLHLPIRTLAFWQHPYCFLATPLVDHEHMWETLDAFWRWIETSPFGCRILDTNYLVAEGPFHECWADFAIGRSTLTLSDFPRAFLEPKGSAQEYLARLVSKKHLDEFLRWERRLRDLGELRYETVRDASEVQQWVEDFVQLEAAGWKGTHGNPFASLPAHTAYLREMTSRGFDQGRAVLLSLILNQKRIAMKLNLMSGNGGYTFKIAYNEELSKYSPGLLLELENIRRTFSDRQVDWLDSCAVPRHVMANRIWGDRRMIRRTLFSTGSAFSDFVISTLPLLRWIRTRIRGKSPYEYFEISTQKKQLSKKEE